MLGLQAASVAGPARGSGLLGAGPALAEPARALIPLIKGSQNKEAILIKFPFLLTLVLFQPKNEGPVS